MVSSLSQCLLSCKALATWRTMSVSRIPQPIAMCSSSQAFIFKLQCRPPWAIQARTNSQAFLSDAAEGGTRSSPDIDSSLYDPKSQASLAFNHLGDFEESAIRSGGVL